MTSIRLKGFREIWLVYVYVIRSFIINLGKEGGGLINLFFSNKWFV